MSATSTNIQFESKKRNILIKKINSLGFAKEDIPTLLYHIDNLSNIIIDSYITAKHKKL